MARTRHFDWKKMGPGETVAEDDFDFGVGNLDSMDTYLWKAYSRRPGAVSAPAVDLTEQLTLTQSSSGGYLVAGRTYYYVYTLVDSEGGESLPSPESTVALPAPVAEPSAPVVSLNPGTGTILPGNYSVALSAYTGDINHESRAPNQARVIVLATGEIVLTLPVLPAGADGFNVYWRRPGVDDFHFLDSIDMSGNPTTYVINGGVTEDAVRTLPRSNNTNSQNSVVVALPGISPEVPEGYTWRIYRSTATGQYRDSLLHWVVEETSEGSGIIVPEYTDLGNATTSGSPPTTSIAIPDYDKIVLTDAAEVQGVLPPANVVYPWVEEFVFPGSLVDTIDGTFKWRFPWDAGKVRWVVISLGRDSAPAVDPVIVDVEYAPAGTNDYITIFNPTIPPTIEVDEDESEEVVPDITDLVKGDRLLVDLTQIGGGATPGDYDLLVQIVCWIWDDTDTTVDRP